MLACPYCELEVSEEYNFCANCEQQVKCTNCKKLLVSGKTRCLVCGMQLISKELPQTQMNEFKFEEEQTNESASRRMSGRFSDNAFGKAVDLLGGNPQFKLVPQVAGITPPPLPKLLPASEKNPDEVVEQVIEVSNSVELSIAPLQQDKKEKALRFFEVEGDNELIVKVPDYKGKSKKEQQQRFTLMYVWAYRHISESAQLSKEHMNSAAKKANLYDSNWANYFEKAAKEFLMNTEAGYKINAPGETKVNQIIDEMDDTGVEGYAYWKNKSKPSKKRSPSNKEDETKLQQWLEMSTNFDDFDIRKLKSAANLAAFAIWIITKQLEVKRAVKPKDAYNYLKGKYKTISVGPNSFSSALSRNPDKFTRTQEGEYFLTEEAEREVEELTQALPIQNAEPEFSNEGEEDI